MKQRELPQKIKHILTARTRKSKSSTPYDDVFRTLLNDCTPLILPIINELFETHYTGDELVEFHPNLHFINQQRGQEEKRITDSSFTVIGTEPRKFLLELQSTSDSSMLVRIFEYSTQIALDSGELIGNTLHVQLPNCGILFLRSNRNTHERMQIQINAGDRCVNLDVRVMKTQEYTIDEIFKKDLLMLVPFYIFSFEQKFEEYNTNEEKLVQLKAEYAGITDRLRDLKEHGNLTEYQHRMLIDMSGKVLESIAAKYDRVKKGVGETMVGGVIETRASRIYHEGMRRGEKRGIEIGENRGEARISRQAAIRLHSMGVDPAKIADVLDVNIMQVRKWLSEKSTEDEE